MVQHSARSWRGEETETNTSTVTTIGEDIPYREEYEPPTIGEQPEVTDAPEDQITPDGTTYNRRIPEEDEVSPSEISVQQRVPDASPRETPSPDTAMYTQEQEDRRKMPPPPPPEAPAEVNSDNMDEQYTDLSLIHI